MTTTLRHAYSGKVRDLYDVDDDHLLMVASDRLSAFDVVMAEPIPNKGRVLTAFTDFWFSQWGGSVPAALVSCDPAVIEKMVPEFAEHPEWPGRSMLVRRAQMIPLECIVRARLAGHAYDDYTATGTVFGRSMPTGMALTDAFPEPIFTTSTKEDEGHDRYIDLVEAASIVGTETLEIAQTLCLDLFARAAATVTDAGLVLADTKFELGVVDGQIVVCDEVLTPDSSRIWAADAIVRGQAPPAFDKQPFRDWVASQSWDLTPPPPPVPPDVVAVTAARYIAAYENVTGRSLNDWYGHAA